LGKIIQLDAHVADLIAAGEVVERPASVVKELMENAIDAGADKLTVEIKGGGMTYMRVTDNGSGIAAQDTETAFLRHATSKLRDEKGLEAIATLGFRGEALAAIAAVSRLELLTREAGAGEGTSLAIDGGVVRAKAAAGCPEGTTMIVRDLFYNTPARLKFVKSDKAEGAAVSAQVLSCALSHPEVSVRYIKDGKEEYHTPGDGRMDSCIYSLFGRDFMRGLLKADTSDGEVTVTGYVSTPDAARGNRSSQYFFVNGRPVKSKTLQAALEQAYKNRLFTGRFPACVLYITLRHSDVDVNVHPAKTEVKFVREHQVFDGVYYASLSALEGLSARLVMPANDNHEADFKAAAEIILPAAGERPAEAHPPEARLPVNGTIPPEVVSSSGGSWNRSSGVAYKAPYRAPAERSAGDSGLSAQSLFRGMPAVSEGTAFASVRDTTRQTYKTYTPVSRTEDAGLREDVLPAGEQLFMEHEPGADKPAFRLIGEALDTYILVERAGSLWLIDKHAAHERLHFDRLKRERQVTGSHKPAFQTLLQPVICSLGSEDTALLLEHAAVFEELGFTLEAFGEEAIAVRQVPADIDDRDIDGLLGQAAQLLRRGGKPDDGLLYDELLHMVACKAAIKAGKASSVPEMEAIALKVMSGEVTHCPHGRPVAVELTKSALDKSFKRA
jgi:DNA mismatch repair protein MutL